MVSKITTTLAASALAFLHFSPAAVAGASPADPASVPIPLKDFARHTQLSQPRLSPDGQYLSVQVNNRNGTNHSLQIFRLADMQRISILRLPKYQLPLNTVWVSPTRLVIEKGKEFGSLAEPFSTGEIITSDIRGRHQDYLYGSKPYGRRSATRALDRGWGWIAGLPAKADGHFYMRTRPWADGNDQSVLYNVDAGTSARHEIADVHVPALSFLVDRQGKAMFAYGDNQSMDYVVYRNDDGTWRKLPSATVGERLMPLRYGPRNTSFYALWSRKGGPDILTQRSATGAQERTLASDTFSSIDDIEWTAPPEKPFAAVTTSGIPDVHFIEANAPDAKLYRALRKAFKGEFVDFINYSEDGGKLLFDVSSDRDPGTFYLMDTRTHKATKLFVAASWIDPHLMSRRLPFRFKASDGMELEGILTLPRGRSEKHMPMVLLPHGGPHGVNDNWFFDSPDGWDAQMLASRGYLVLQVNYRGSDGRGPTFTQAGYRKWGTRIQQDLIDGVKWTIAKGYTDPQRICVYGASFGGYSALMSVIRAPGLFKCAIGYDGVYDLKMLYGKGDIHQTLYGRNYLATVIGHDDKELTANSPAELAAKIKVPVFLIHGADDNRAPLAGAEEMRAALKNVGNPPEWMVKSGEGHGFYDEHNNIERMQRMLAFLKKYIGPGAPPMAQTAASTEAAGAAMAH